MALVSVASVSVVSAPVRMLVVIVGVITIVVMMLGVVALPLWP